MRPVNVPDYIMRCYSSGKLSFQQTLELNKQVQSFYSDEPEVSVVIPAYNEEATILQTLTSLAANTTQRSVEFVVVNNNSADRTEDMALGAGTRCIKETTQGITPARNTGLAAARGTLYSECRCRYHIPERLDRRNGKAAGK